MTPDAIAPPAHRAPGTGLDQSLLPPPRTTADTPDAIQIRTPEQVAITLPIAGVGTRMLAAWLDALVMIGIIIASLLLYAFVGSAIDDQVNTFAAGSVLTALLILGLFFFIFGYYAVLEIVWDGRTVGKRALHLGGVRGEGTPAVAASMLARTPGPPRAAASPGVSR